jgi:hypothetical protein
MGWGLDGGIVESMIPVSRGKSLFVGLEFRGRWVDGTGVSWGREREGGLLLLGRGRKKGVLILRFLLGLFGL